MPSFSAKSKQHLASCDPDLIRLFNEVVKHFDCTVTCGFRSQVEQDEAYRTGRSQLQFPASNHNVYPSRAVDVIPYPVDWDDIDRFLLFIGFVKGVASQMGIKVRSGIDWDDDWNIKEHRFLDYPHFELVIPHD